MIIWPSRCCCGRYAWIEVGQFEILAFGDTKWINVFLNAINDLFSWHGTRIPSWRNPNEYQLHKLLWRVPVTPFAAAHFVCVCCGLDPGRDTTRIAKQAEADIGRVY